MFEVLLADSKSDSILQLISPGDLQYLTWLLGTWLLGVTGFPPNAKIRIHVGQHTFELVSHPITTAASEMTGNFYIYVTWVAESEEGEREKKGEEVVVW